MTGEDARRIITFYSYKGGTGRTMALANTAWILASAGHRVLVVDWDLDAPGLDRFLHPFLSEKQLRETPGVLELVSRSTHFLLSAQGLGDPAHRIEPPSDYEPEVADGITLNRCLIQVDWDFPAGGQLYYLPAGTKNKGYLAAFSQFNWKEFMEGTLATRFLEGLKREFTENFDYVLIDSRTGLNDISDICTVNLPQAVVTCFTPSSQSIEGAAGVAERIETLYGNRDIRLLPVPMRVENAEADRLDAARGQIQYRFDRIVRKHVPERDPEDYWRGVEIPYVPIYSYEETLAPFREQPGDPKSLLSAYERLADVITDGQVTSMPRIDEPLRRKTLERYTRHRPPSISDVYVSFVPQDRSWANWASAILGQAGFKVHLAQEGTVEGALARDEIERGVESASHTLIIFSQDYQRSSRFRTTWEAVWAESDRRTHQLVSMKVDPQVSLEAPFTEQLADMTRCKNQEEGRDTLLTWFGRGAESLTHNHFTGAEIKLPRFPKTEPLVFQVPLRTSSFTGRTELLEGIREKLWQDDTRALVLKGMGGVGKTLLAQEFAYRYKSDYDVVYHIQAEEDYRGLEAYANLATRLKLPERPNPTDTAKAVHEALNDGDRYDSYLLILDNVPEPGTFLEFLMDGRRGHILVTSQLAEGWGRFVDTLDVPVFERNESIAHLRTRLPDCGRNEAYQIAEALGDLPIAVERAAAYIEQTRADVHDYIQQLQPHAAGAPDDNTVGEVKHTWEFALGQLRSNFPAAMRLLQICSYYGPEPISMDLLEGPEVKRALGDVRTVSRAYKELSKFSLVTVDRKARSITVHRMMQVAMRGMMSEEEREAAQEVVYRSLVAARPGGDDPENPNTWEQYRVIWPHLGTPWAKTAADEGIRELFVDRVRQLRRRGELTQAMKYSAQRVVDWTRDGSPDERWTLHMRFQIANVMRAQGKYEESLALDQEVLERQRVVLEDEDDQHILMTTSSIAADLRGLGRLSEALRYDEETYEKYGEIYGEDHARTLSAANNLAVALRLSGEYHKARDLDRRTLELREAIQLEDHPLTIESAVNLGRDLRDCGDYEESVTLLQRAYERCLRNPRLTQGSPTVLNTAKGLAGSLRRAGRATEAEELVRHVLRSTPAPEGEKSSSEQLLLEMSLAGDIAAQGRVDEGLKLIRKVHEDLRDTLGEEHSQTVACAVNHAVLLLHDIGAVRPEVAAEAEELLRRAERRFTELNGEHHPHVLICRTNLAVAQAALAEWEAARRTSIEAYELLKEGLEPNHPSTLTCAGNHAVVLSRLNLADEARTKHHDALSALSKRIGREHPRVRALKDWKLSCLDLEPHPI